MFPVLHYASAVTLIFCPVSLNLGAGLEFMSPQWEEDQSQIAHLGSLWITYQKNPQCLKPLSCGSSLDSRSPKPGRLKYISGPLLIPVWILVEKKKKKRSPPRQKEGKSFSCHLASARLLRVWIKRYHHVRTHLVQLLKCHPRLVSKFCFIPIFWFLSRVADIHHGGWPTW